MKKSKAILLVGHGSRQPGSNQAIERFADEWRRRRIQAAANGRDGGDNIPIELCFIELADILLDEGLDRAADMAEEVAVVPLILNAAGHVKLEIPQAVDQARKRHPKTRFTIARHLGLGEKILTIMKRRLGEAMKELDWPDPQTSGVILLGRGSSDPAANAETARLARLLQEGSRHELVEIAFTGVTFPRLEKAIQRQAALGMSQIIILPLYLFPGLLSERITRQTKRLERQSPRIAFASGKPIGMEDEIFTLLDERAEEAFAAHKASPLECDACPWRTHAGAAHEHHHHGHGGQH